ncbi:hypothetical protein M8C21_016296, partial [Ambrosia artemisiifolia]
GSTRPQALYLAFGDFAEKYGLAGASHIDIVVKIKNHCSNDKPYTISLLFQGSKRGAGQLG